MSQTRRWTTRYDAVMNRLHARLATGTRPVAGFAIRPEPRAVGHIGRGRRLLAGNLLFAGELVEAPGRNPWDISPPDMAWARELHGHGWLDDLAAVGDANARITAQYWVWDWISRYGGGRGPGWAPDLTGRRLIQWIGHAFFLTRGQQPVAKETFHRSLARQTVFLSRRWRAAPPGLSRIEALAGLIHAALSLKGMERHAAPALRALARDSHRQVDADGGIARRNPEELLEIFTLLAWTVQVLQEARRDVPEPLRAAVARIAPTLRGLRHMDGGLARFHGGGRGLEGRLEGSLAIAGVKTQPAADRLHMGFARLAAGRTSVILDAARPPAGLISASAHASTLALELTSGRRPLIVSCGPGADFGPAWRRASRATPSHSTLAIEGYSSSRLGSADRRGREILIEVPGKVLVERKPTAGGIRMELAHNGYQPTHGLAHARTVELASDGRGILGEDLLTTLTETDRGRFDRALDRSRLRGVAFSIRFHLHPDVEAAVDPDGAVISLTLKSGEIWLFRQDGSAEMSLEPSVYLENGRLRPRVTSQVVLSARALAYATRIGWSLFKAEETPTALRDLVRDDEETADADD